MLYRRLTLPFLLLGLTSCQSSVPGWDRITHRDRSGMALYVQNHSVDSFAGSIVIAINHGRAPVRYKRTWYTPDFEYRGSIARFGLCGTYLLNAQLSGETFAPFADLGPGERTEYGVFHVELGAAGSQPQIGLWIEDPMTGEGRVLWSRDLNEVWPTDT